MAQQSRTVTATLKRGSCPVNIAMKLPRKHDGNVTALILRAISARQLFVFTIQVGFARSRAYGGNTLYTLRTRNEVIR